MITPRKRMEVKRRDGRVVEVLTPGRDRFSLDHDYVRADPGFFTTLPAASAEARATLARMQGRPGHTRAHTSLIDTLRAHRPAGRVLPRASGTRHAPVLPRTGSPRSRVLS